VERQAIFRDPIDDKGKLKSSSNKKTEPSFAFQVILIPGPTSLWIHMLVVKIRRIQKTEYIYIPVIQFNSIISILLSSDCIDCSYKAS